MVRALPDDGKRYETVHGELLVSPAPRLSHQEIVGRLYRALSLYLERHPVGHVLFSPADISWGPDILVQPDLFVADIAQVRTGRWDKVTDLRLVVEVLSSGTAHHDRVAKRKLYQEAGIPLYWIVDIDAAAVEVWIPAAHFPAIERDALAWHPDGADTPLLLPLAPLFKPI